jgi:radical SAM superfamily enzyme YgiQ (UPF0313 family)
VRITLVSPPTPNPAPTYFGPPYGLALLGAILEREGHAVTAYDWDRDITEAMLADLPRLLEEDRPELFGISVLSVTRGAAVRLARRVKELAPDLPLVLGGPYATTESIEMLERTPADILCIGDGEITLVELVDALAAGTELAEVPGLMIRSADGPLRTPKRPDFLDLDSLPAPNFELFDMARMLAAYNRPRLLALHAAAGERTYAANAAIMVLGSRGCIYRCSFCPMSKWKGGTRTHSATYTVDLILALRDKYDHRHFVMGDNIFTWPRDRAMALCDELIARDAGISWICMTRADMVDAELLQRMADAGCREISYGIETLDWSVQKQMRKNLKVQRVPEVFTETHDAGIASTLMMMIGNEGESRASLTKTAALARDIDPDRLLLYTTMVYPGTTLWDKAAAAGMFTPEYLAADDPEVLHYTAELGETELRYLEKMLHRRTTWLSPAEDAAAAQRQLTVASFRSDQVVIGPEALSRKDLPALVATAKETRLRELWLHTDAALLISPRVREAMKGWGANKIMVPLYSMNADRHDEVVGRPGALVATRRGLLAWTRAGGVARVLLFVDRYGVQQLRSWLPKLQQHGVRDVMFVWGGDPAGWGAVAPDALPRLDEAGPAMAAAVEAAAELGIEAMVMGVPACAWPADPIVLWEPWRPLDDRVDGERHAIAREALPVRRFADRCAQCEARGTCDGVAAAYLDEVGDDELRPIGVPAVAV